VRSSRCPHAQLDTFPDLQIPSETKPFCSAVDCLWVLFESAWAKRILMGLRPLSSSKAFTAKIAKEHREVCKELLGDSASFARGKHLNL